MSTGTKYNAFALRMAKKAAGSMPDSLFIQTGTESTDARGFSSTSFSDAGAAVPCRVEGQVGREVVVDGRVQSG
jgi:hypothetical protein